MLSKLDVHSEVGLPWSTALPASRHVFALVLDGSQALVLWVQELLV